jgi:CHAD domain-containing protein
MDTAYLALAAKYVRRQAKQLAEQLDGVRAASDIEFVHRARVASRRLRAGLRVFADCFGAKATKRWRKQIRNVTREMGEARDRDVQIDFLFAFLHGLKVPAVYPGIVGLLGQLEQQRAELQPQVVKAVGRLRAKKTIAEMLFACRRIASKLKPTALGGPCIQARRLAEKHVVGRLEEMLPLQDSLREPEAKPRHHALRIAAKRLRYTMEVVKPLYGPPLEPVIESVRAMQTLLGDMHDCDVWEQRLEAFVAAERKRIRRHFGHDGPLARLEVGIEYLRQDRRARREQAFGELAALWAQWTQEGLWDALRRILRGETVAVCSAGVSPATAAGTAAPRPDDAGVSPAEAVGTAAPPSQDVRISSAKAAGTAAPQYPPHAAAMPEEYVQSPRTLAAAFREPARPMKPVRETVPS